MNTMICYLVVAGIKTFQEAQNSTQTETFKSIPFFFLVFNPFLPPPPPVRLLKNKQNIKLHKSPRYPYAEISGNDV